MLKEMWKRLLCCFLISTLTAGAVLQTCSAVYAIPLSWQGLLRMAPYFGVLMSILQEVILFFDHRNMELNMGENLEEDQEEDE